MEREHAMDLGEICKMVLDLVDSRETLRNASLVNKTFSQSAMALLWEGNLTGTYDEREAPNLASIYRLHQRCPASTSRYLSLIKYLDVGDVRGRFSPNVWRNLWRQTLAGNLNPKALLAHHDVDLKETPVDETILGPVWTENLRVLDLHKASCTNAFLSELQRTATRLRFFKVFDGSISGPGHITEEALANFLTSMHALEHIHISDSFAAVAKASLFPHLLRRQGLKSLTLGAGIVIPWAELSSAGAGCFAELESFGAGLHACAHWPSLIARLKSLERLIIHDQEPHEDDDDPVWAGLIGSLVNCPGLRELELLTRGLTEPRQFEEVANSCRSIKRLVIGMPGSGVVESTTLREGCIGALAKGLPDLEVLEVYATCSLSDKEIVLLSQNCPNLQNLHIDAMVDIFCCWQEFSDVPLQFPALQHLHCEALYLREDFDDILEDDVDSLKREFDKMMEIFPQRLPRLRTLVQDDSSGQETDAAKEFYSGLYLCMERTSAQFRPRSYETVAQRHIREAARR